MIIPKNESQHDISNTQCVLKHTFYGNISTLVEFEAEYDIDARG